MNINNIIYLIWVFVLLINNTYASSIKIRTNEDYFEILQLAAAALIIGYMILLIGNAIKVKFISRIWSILFLSWLYTIVGFLIFMVLGFIINSL